MNGGGPRTVNSTLALSTAVTRRVLNSSITPLASEALLLMDELGAGPASPAPAPCPASSTGTGASSLGQPSPDAPSPMATAVLSASDTALGLDGTQVMVGFSVPAMNWQIRDGLNQTELAGPLKFRQCSPNNPMLAAHSSSAKAPDGVSFVIRFQEAWPSSFQTLEPCARGGWRDPRP